MKKPLLIAFLMLVCLSQSFCAPVNISVTQKVTKSTNGQYGIQATQYFTLNQSNLDNPYIQLR